MLGLFKKAKEESKPDDDEQIGSSLVNGYELRPPSNQNAIDLVSGWSTSFPPQFNVDAGTLDLSTDKRLHWGIECFGDIQGKRIAELGPLEGGHTLALEAAGGRVDAVESSGVAYLKCLIAKEICGLKNARFHLGDCTSWLEDNDAAYDLIVASGILYHMVDPLRLLRAMARRSDNLFVWTMVSDDPAVEPTRVERLAGQDVRLYLVPYGARTNAFCGGANPDAMWINKDDLIAVLGALGYATLLTNHADVSEYGASSSFFASRRP